MHWPEGHYASGKRRHSSKTVYGTWKAADLIPNSPVTLSMGRADATTRGRNYRRRTRKGMEFVADALAEYLLVEQAADGEGGSDVPWKTL